MPARRSSLRWLTLAALLAVPLLLPSARAQDALRVSLAGSQAAEARKRALRDQPYNLEWGPARFLVSAALGLEASDNIRYRDEDRVGDLIVRPTVGLFSVIPLSDRNALRFDVALGYRKYVNESEYDSLIIRPGSELALDLFVKDTTINLHNRFNYTHDPLEQGAVSGAAEYGGFHNTTGASFTWDRYELLLSGGYDHSWFLSDVDRYDYLSRQGDTLYLRVTLLPQAALEWGIEVAGGLNDYSENVLNDGRNANLGAFLEWSPSRFVSATVRGGYTLYQFDDDGLVGPTPDRNDYYVEMSLSHRVNQWLNHALSGGRSFNLGVNSDLQELWQVRYSLGWRAKEWLTLTPQAYYERGAEEGVYLAERYDRVGFGLSTSYRIARKASLGLSYGLTIKDSEFENRDYRENRVAVSLQYTF